MLLVIWGPLKWAKIQMTVQKFVNGSLKCVFLCISPLMQGSQGVELKRASEYISVRCIQWDAEHWNQLLIYT